ncbi:MAG: hypothetical protein KA736_08105 [Crocinitomicaceae bacterium]|nr:hypothetical protein [Crocinitomicaceae bacterium]MBP6032303.1 hypothetical protein [Crocinitomicaceae bacterium]
MRFRRLSTEELFSLETEFKQFLVIHELYDEEWRLLAEKEPEKAEQFIIQFSELVLGKVYQQISFLVHFSSTMVSFFDMRNNPLKAYHIKCSEGLSLQNEADLQQALSVHFNQLQFYKGEKNLQEEKADEVFDLIKKGSESCDEAYFLKYTQLFEGI